MNYCDRDDYDYAVCVGNPCILLLDFNREDERRKPNFRELLCIEDQDVRNY